jgi:predicted metallo-beta-lactamase superfamily hydrolase
MIWSLINKTTALLLLSGLLAGYTYYKGYTFAEAKYIREIKEANEKANERVNKLVLENRAVRNKLSKKNREILDEYVKKTPDAVILDDSDLGVFNQSN